MPRPGTRFRAISPCTRRELALSRPAEPPGFGGSSPCIALCIALHHPASPLHHRASPLHHNASLCIGPELSPTPLALHGLLPSASTCLALPFALYCTLLDEASVVSMPESPQGDLGGLDVRGRKTQGSASPRGCQAPKSRSTPNVSRWTRAVPGPPEQASSQNAYRPALPALCLSAGLALP